MKNNESMEMYLETIYTLGKKNSTVHAIDVATALNYSKPSVSRAMKLLQSNNYITLNNSMDISLTEEGLAKAKKVYERHVVLTKTFINLGAPKELAEEDACRIEHFISDEMFEIIKGHLKEGEIENDN